VRKKFYSLVSSRAGGGGNGAGIGFRSASVTSPYLATRKETTCVWKKEKDNCLILGGEEKRGTKKAFGRKASGTDLGKGPTFLPYEDYCRHHIVEKNIIPHSPAEKKKKGE